MGRPPKFSRERVAQVALGLVDQQGLDALSMRTLARALGTGPMTLYNHVTDREHLDLLVVDAVFDEVRWPPVPYEDWREEVTEISTAVWRAVRAHPRAIPLILTRRSGSRAVLEVAEAIISAFSRGGLRGPALLVAFRAVTAYVMGFAQAELAGPLAAEAGESKEHLIARMRQLPREKFPSLVALSAVAARSDAVTEFNSGLAALLDGLAARGA